MEKEIIIEKKEEELRDQKAEEIFRIAITKEAEKALGTLVDKVNRGFDGGKINRTEMASLALTRFLHEIDEGTLKEVRSLFFDEVAALEAMLRKAKERGHVSSEIKQLLMKDAGFDSVTKKSTKTKVDN